MTSSVMHYVQESTIKTWVLIQCIEFIEREKDWTHRRLFSPRQVWNIPIFQLLQITCQFSVSTISIQSHKNFSCITFTTSTKTNFSLRGVLTEDLITLNLPGVRLNIKQWSQFLWYFLWFAKGFEVHNIILLTDTVKDNVLSMISFKENGYSEHIGQFKMRTWPGCFHRQSQNFLLSSVTSVTLKNTIVL